MTIAWDQVSKRFGPVQALDQVSLIAPSGRLTVLMGASGSGKSTLLKTVNRLVKPDSGQVWVDGRPVTQGKADDWRRLMGYVPPAGGLFPHLTVEQNIEIVPRVLGWSPSARMSRTQELLNLVALEPGKFWGRYPSELSSGQAQRVSIARALAADPPILLFDEPFGALDPPVRKDLQQQFRTIQKTLQKTVLFVTHDVEEAVVLADELVVLDHGRVLGQGRPEALVLESRNPQVRQLLGAEGTLALLSRWTVGEAMGSWPWDGTPRPSIAAQASLKQALATMVATGSFELRVESDPAATLRIQDLGQVSSSPRPGKSP